LLAKKKAVSGAISAMFVVLIFMMAMVAIYTYQTYYDAYLDEVHARNQMDWERINEKMNIISVARLDDGSLNLTVQNLGPIAIHITTLWVYAYDGDYQKYQYQYGIKYNENPEKGGAWFDSAETLTNLGQNNSRYSPYRLIDTYTVPGVLQVTNELAIVLADPTWHYIIKLETARGNVFVGNYDAQKETIEWSDAFLIATLAPNSGIQFTNVGPRDVWITSASIVPPDGTPEATTTNILPIPIAKGETGILSFSQTLPNSFIVLFGFDDLGRPYTQRLQI
jgi:hypothetical protein